MSQTIPKPWGKEILLTDKSLPYVGKIIFIDAGKRWSTQIHENKIETFCCYSGQAKLVTGKNIDHLDSVMMEDFQGYTIQSGTIHRIEAITDTVIFESSTPEKGTTLRIQDDYQRPHETEEIRNLPNRGWNPQN